MHLKVNSFLKTIKIDRTVGKIILKWASNPRKSIGNQFLEIFDVVESNYDIETYKGYMTRLIKVQN